MNDTGALLHIVHMNFLTVPTNRLKGPGVKGTRTTDPTPDMQGLCSNPQRAPVTWSTQRGRNFFPPSSDRSVHVMNCTAQFIPRPVSPMLPTLLVTPGAAVSGLPPSWAPRSDRTIKDTTAFTIREGEKIP